MEQSSLIEILKDFLKDYKPSPKLLEPDPSAGLPLFDSAFDKIFFTEFCKHLKSIGKFDLWVKLNEDMDKNFETKEYQRGTRLWNKLCGIVERKVRELIKQNRKPIKATDEQLEILNQRYNEIYDYPYLAIDYCGEGSEARSFEVDDNGRTTMVVFEWYLNNQYALRKREYIRHPRLTHNQINYLLGKENVLCFADK